MLLIFYSFIENNSFTVWLTFVLVEHLPVDTCRHLAID